MNRKLILLLLLVVPTLWSCAKTYTYQSYEVVRNLDRVNPGEDIKLVQMDGELIRGTVVHVEGNILTVATFDKGRKKVAWSDVLLLERVKMAVVIVP
ncbi:MAG: hypothetical protein VX910_11435 [Candidatus Latescibacterota bacterium]|nr:hypothetical protein [Candidatus Latescibacterota bacterium]